MYFLFAFACKMLMCENSPDHISILYLMISRRKRNFLNACSTVTIYRSRRTLLGQTAASFDQDSIPMH